MEVLSGSFITAEMSAEAAAAGAARQIEAEANERRRRERGRKMMKKVTPHPSPSQIPRRISLSLSQPPLYASTAPTEKVTLSQVLRMEQICLVSLPLFPHREEVTGGQKNTET